jgi:hypothetical protein
MRPYSSFLHGRIASAAMVCAFALFGCAAVEFGYRLHSQRSVFAFNNWRAWRIEYQTFGGAGKFDPLLGWVSKEWHEGDGHNTIAHGLRRNPQGQEDQVRAGAILAVGSEFTHGGRDVDDDETWPAQLERLVGTPVLNGAVVGYATDQIVLRAELLLPLLRPKTLIVGFAGEEIQRASLSSYGSSKPYFTLENGELRYHPPAPLIVHDAATPAWQARVRDILGYSAVLDVVLGLVAPRYWTGTAGQPVFKRIDSDPAGVTCALLVRLKQRTDADGVRLLLFMQHAQRVVTQKEQPGEDAKKVTQCATTTGIEVVDQFEPLRALAFASRDGLRDLYAKGLMSAKGNRHAAELLARAIDKQR